MKKFRKRRQPDFDSPVDILVAHAFLDQGMEGYPEFFKPRIVKNCVYLDEAARIGTIPKSGGYGHGVALAIIRNEKLEYLDAKVNLWTVPNNTEYCSFVDKLYEEALGREPYYFEE